MAVARKLARMLAKRPIGGFSLSTPSTSSKSGSSMGAAKLTPTGFNVAVDMQDTPLEQFADRLHAEVGQRDRAVLRPGQLAVRIDAEGAVNRGRDFARRDRPALGAI